MTKKISRKQRQRYLARVGAFALERKRYLDARQQVEEQAGLSDEQKLSRIARMGRRLRRAWRTVWGAADPQATADEEFWRGLPTLGTAKASGETTFPLRYDEAKADRRRLIAYGDYDDMLVAWPPYKKACDLVADTATAGDEQGERGFELEFAEGVPDKVKDVCADTKRRMRLDDASRGMLWLTIQKGDCFEEKVMDENFVFLELQHRPAETMYRIEDEGGHVLYFTQKKDVVGHEVRIPKWKTVHMRCDHIRGNRYGTAIGYASRLMWRKLHIHMELQAIRRMVRAPQRLRFEIDARLFNTSKWEKAVDEMEADYSMEYAFSDDGATIDLRRTLESVAANIYVPKTADGVGAVDTLEGDANLDRIRDIIFIHRNAIASLPVPPAYLGFEEDVNAKATLLSEALQYARYVRGKQDLLATTLEREVFISQLTLLAMSDPSIFAGWSIVDVPDPVRCVFPPVSVPDEKMRAERDLIMAQLIKALGVDVGLDIPWLLKYYRGLSDEEIALAWPYGESEPPARPRKTSPVQPGETEAALAYLDRHGELMSRIDTLLDCVTDVRRHTRELDEL